MDVLYIVLDLLGSFYSIFEDSIPFDTHLILSFENKFRTLTIIIFFTAFQFLGFGTLGSHKYVLRAQKHINQIFIINLVSILGQMVWWCNSSISNFGVFLSGLASDTIPLKKPTRPLHNFLHQH